MAIRKQPIPNTKVRVSIFNRITLFQNSERRGSNWIQNVIMFILTGLSVFFTYQGTQISKSALLLAQKVDSNTRQIDTLGQMLTTLRIQTGILLSQNTAIKSEVEQMKLIAGTLILQSKKISAELEYSNDEQKFRNNNQHIERAKELFELKKSADDLRNSLYKEDNKNGRTREDLKFVTQVKDFFDKAIGYPVLLEDSAFLFKLIEYKYNLPGLTVQLEYEGTSAETYHAAAAMDIDTPPTETLDSLGKIKRRNDIDNRVQYYLKKENEIWNGDYKKLTESLNDFLRTALNPFIVKKFKEYNLLLTNP